MSPALLLEGNTERCMLFTSTVISFAGVKSVELFMRYSPSRVYRAMNSCFVQKCVT